MSADSFQDWLDRGSPWPDPHDQDPQLDIYDLPTRDDEADADEGEVAA